MADRLAINEIVSCGGDARDIINTQLSRLNELNGDLQNCADPTVDDLAAIDLTTEGNASRLRLVATGLSRVSVELDAAAAKLSSAIKKACRSDIARGFSATLPSLANLKENFLSDAILGLNLDEVDTKYKAMLRFVVSFNSVNHVREYHLKTAIELLDSVGLPGHTEPVARARPHVDYAHQLVQHVDTDLISALAFLRYYPH